ncbi:serine/threonine phosphatase [Anabaena sp. UHCC 0204]|uniref:serine/threonine phosphatase n=1 Tax=Anabaena sp. UHCC 0204 TaxID=2590009 RepID=UPI001445A490|nr:serine/threonine phosphatase [Anabaena sp. UHCC 0204]MTJ10701.1 serine/threonine phosphatase [Anabaena sp. UHCC 0204]
MLICPQCKFENPNSNKFCQSCGTSLAHQVCPECGVDVAINAQHCHKCGAECGTIWWAMITQVTSAVSTIEETGELTPNSENPVVGITDTSPFLKLALDSYLDSQQRYRLLEFLPNPEIMAANKSLTMRVLDCQPYQVSLIEASLGHETKIATQTIPDLAKAYLELQVEMHPAIPKIHDAWQQDDLEVVLLEDRSNLPMLVDVWQQDTITMLEILYWFYQMTQLWELLEKVGCRQSLLELSNLRVDEDQVLVLQRLYIEPSALIPQPCPQDEKQALSIKSLGQVWRNLCKQSQRTQFGFVVQMLDDLESGKINTLEQLRSLWQTQLSLLEAESTPEKSPSSSTILQFSDETEDTMIRNDDIPTMVLSMQLSSLEYAGYTDVGRQRDHNEDYFGIDSKVHKLELPKNRLVTAQSVYILCDGMGGHAGGEVASALAVNTIRKYFQETWVDAELPRKESIREAVYLANQAIYELNQKEARAGIGRMGTTLVMLLLQDNQAAIAHVGDSRLYCLTRKRGLEQLTIDHEVGQREIARGVEPTIAYGRADAYQLTQALGPRNENSIHPDVEFFDINEDMLLVLVSDGLSDNDCLETNWQTHLQPLLSSSSNLEKGLQDLIDLANEHNGHDNITAILVRVKVRPSQQGLFVN